MVKLVISILSFPVLIEWGAGAPDPQLRVCIFAHGLVHHGEKDTCLKTILGDTEIQKELHETKSRQNIVDGENIQK